MKKNMNTQLLKKLYSIYSPSGKEQKMVRFLCSYINGLPGEISLEKDSFGNLYVTKGSGESYPCLVSHLDQVSHCRHSKDFRAVEAKGILFGYSPSKRRFENLGADDKNGIFICLECLRKYDVLKVVFFREEETGCRGSSRAYMPFFDDVRFVVQPDRKGNSDLITAISFTELCSGEFIREAAPERWGYAENNGLMTDVLTLKENGLEVSCANVSCGYYNAHTDEEITVKKDLQKCLDFVEHLIEDCTAVYVHQGTDALYDSFFECEEEIHDILHRHPSLSLEDLRSLYSPSFPRLSAEDWSRIYEDYRLVWDDVPDDSADAKNIDDCVTYILNYVQKSGCNGFTDGEIYGQAVHYYDENEIEVGKPIQCQVAVNHIVELTAEEKAEARQQAVRRYQDEELRKLQNRTKPTKAKTETQVQPSLFDFGL